MSEVHDPQGKHSSAVGMRRLAGLASRVFILSLILVVCATLSGFFQFYRSIQGDSAAIPAMKADGIVVLTGGADRVSSAVELLRKGYGKRLLISGANPKSSLTAIRRSVGGENDLYTCCVDIDQAATDTYGNAEETSKWVSRNGFDSLIVVTSNYHMPRSLVEMQRSMPSTQFVPYPVDYQPLAGKGWISDPISLKIVASEYLKYLAALVRSGFSDRPNQASLAELGKL
ncbi:MAG: YdcF family protein [Rhizobiaceae bacterium]